MRWILIVLVGWSLGGCASMVVAIADDAAVSTADAADAAQPASCFRTALHNNFACYGGATPEEARTNCETDRLRHLDESPDPSCSPRP